MKFTYLLVALFIGTAHAAPKSPQGLCANGVCAAPVEEAPAEPSVTSAVKWNPGHYMQLFRGNNDTRQATRFAYYDAIDSNPNIEGVVVPFRWAQLEGANRGDYDEGVRLVRSEIAKLKSLSSPKRLFIRPNDVAYGYSAESTFPAYLLKTSGATFAIGQGTQWRRWNSKYMGWYIDMLKNLCEEFDNEPYFEGLYLTRETAQSWSGEEPVSDYDTDAFFTQLARLGEEVKQACPNTNVVMPVNYIGGGQSQANAMLAHQKLHKLGQGGPDVIVPAKGRQYPHGYHALLGTSPEGGHDYRGEIPVIYSTESTNVNGALADASLQEIWDFATQTLRVSHLFWDRYDGGASGVDWKARLAFIEKNPTFPHTECPAVYESCTP